MIAYCFLELTTNIHFTSSIYIRCVESTEEIKGETLAHQRFHSFPVYCYNDVTSTQQVKGSEKTREKKKRNKAT